MEEDSENMNDEKKIIQELKMNPKENIDKIANRCGLSRQRVLALIRKLEKDKTIWGYSAVLDNEKLGLKKYLILIKRTYKPLSKERLETIVNGKIKQKFIGLGVDIDFILFLNGFFDFALCATSDNVWLIEKFCDALRAVFKDCISEFKVLDVIFPLLQSGIENPNLKELLNYF